MRETAIPESSNLIACASAGAANATAGEGICGCPRPPTALARTRTATAARAPLLTRDMLAALGASSSFGFALAVFYLLPKFLVEQLAASAAEVGVVMSSFGVATVIGAVAVAFGVDRYGRRDLIGIAALVTAVASFAFVAVDRLGPSLLLLRGTQGICFAVVLTAVGAIIADLAPPERLGQALGLSGASMLLMSAVAPPIVEPLAERCGWSAVFVLAASAAALGALVSRSVREAPDFRSVGRPVPSTGERWAVLRERATLHYGLVTAAVGSAFGVMFTFEQPFVLELGRERVGGFFIAYSVAAMVVRTLFGSVPDRFGRHRVAVSALSLYALAAFAMALTGASGVDLIGAVLGVAHGLFFPAFNALVIGRAASADRGKLLSVFTGTFYGGMALGVLSLGVVADLLGYRAVFAAAGSSITAAGVLLVSSNDLAERRRAQ